MFFCTSIGLEVETTVRTLTRPVVCSFLPYTKESPLDIEGHLLHKDASMLELAMPPVDVSHYHNNHRGTIATLQTVYNNALAHARGLLPADTTLSCEAAVEYTDEELERDPYASVLGCSQSNNLYTGFTPVPSEYENNTRYGGLHINFGRNAGSTFTPSEVLLLDASLGLLSVAEHEQPFKEQMVERRKYYGRAGEYRLKDFGNRVAGLEYRTLPASTWETMGAQGIFDALQLAGRTLVSSLVPHHKDIQAAINECDGAAASQLLNTIYQHREAA